MTQVHQIPKIKDSSRKELYESPLILLAQTDELPVAYWDSGPLTYGQRLLGIGGFSGNKTAHRALFDRLRAFTPLFRSWLTLTSCDAGIKQATTLQKSDIDHLPFPANEADLDITNNDQSILDDAFDYYRDFQRLGDDAEMMRESTPDDHKAFADVFARQINVVHKKLEPLPVEAWAGVSCQPFVIGTVAPDWEDAAMLEDKLAKLLRAKKSPSLTTVRILRVFDGPFVFLIKPNRLRYWLRSIALRDADEALADLRALGF